MLNRAAPNLDLPQVGLLLDTIRGTFRKSTPNFELSVPTPPPPSRMPWSKLSFQASTVYYS